MPGPGSPNKLLCLLVVCSFVEKWRQNLLFPTNELRMKDEITILLARDITQPRLRAGALWVERYKEVYTTHDSLLGFCISPVQSSVNFFFLCSFSSIFTALFDSLTFVKLP